MPSAKSIAAAIEAIPTKKEDLKKAFEDLRLHASSLSSFTLQWKDLEDYFDSIERSIEERFRLLEAKEVEYSAVERSSEKAKPAPLVVPEEEELDPRPELRSICVNMDGKGVVAFINENRKDLVNIRKELNRALRAASDPAKLVLDAVEGFYPTSGGLSDGELNAHRRTCILLLERLRLISAEIKPPVGERAKKMAKQWKGKIPQDVGQNHTEILGFLQLLDSYGVMSVFEADDILDLLVPIAKRRQALDLCKSFQLSEKMPDFIRKLSSKGRQIDAVKFVYAFELEGKFPPVQLLREYVRVSKKIAQEVRKKGNNSAQAQNEATAKEIAALRAVVKTIEEYKLNSEYSPESLQKRITQLEQQKAEKKRSAATALANPKGQAKQQHPNKRPRPPAATNAVAAHPQGPISQTQPQHALVDRAPFMASAGPYGLSGSNYLYEHSSSAYAANPLGLGATRSPPASLLYSDPLAGSSLYDRPGAYSSYSYSGGLPPQYNPSLYR